MAKRIVKVVLFNICIIILNSVIISNRGLGLNCLNFQLSPGKFGAAWAVTIFIVSVLIYVNAKNYYSIFTQMEHRKKLLVKDVVLNDVDNALEKLEEAKRENDRLTLDISNIYSMVKEFQNKLDILNQLLANHGSKISEWKWIVEFNQEAKQEIFANVREVIDTSIVFDNENAKDSNVKSAVKKIQASAERIEEILIKYDECLDVVQKVLERKLRSHGSIVTESLDTTLKSAKTVYGIAEESIESKS